MVLKKKKTIAIFTLLTHKFKKIIVPAKIDLHGSVSTYTVYSMKHKNICMYTHILVEGGTEFDRIA